MSGFLLSSANQTFAAVEETYGQAAPLSSAQQIVASSVAVRQTTSPSIRRDKSGSRTCARSTGGRRETAFEIRSFLTSQGANGMPFCDPLFTAALGSAASSPAPLTIATAAATGQTFTTVAPHGLNVGSAVAFAGEVRFVTSVSSSSGFVVNAPFSTAVAGSTVLPSAATYRLGTVLPSLTLFDFWGSQGSFSRVLPGAVVNELEIDVSGDHHGLRFTGSAADVIDSAAFVAGSAGLTMMPQLPAQAPISYSIVPGHLGQVWLGNPSSRSCTLTQATIRLQNNVVLRDHELVSGLASSSSPGRRLVEVDISLLVQDNNTTAELYEIARARGSMPVLLQLGQQSGQMMAVYLPSVTPNIPIYDDAGEWLTWHVTNSQAMGEADDELYLAFA